MPAFRLALVVFAVLLAWPPSAWPQSVSIAFSVGPARETTTFNGQTVVNVSSAFGYSERRTIAVQDLDFNAIHTETAADRSVSAIVLRCKNSLLCVERAGVFDASTRLPGVAHTHHDESMSIGCTPGDCAKLVTAVRAANPRGGIPAAPTSVECEALRSIYTSGGRRLTLPEKCLQAGDRESTYQTPDRPPQAGNSPATPAPTKDVTIPESTEPDRKHGSAQPPLTDDQMKIVEDWIKGGQNPDKKPDFLKKIEDGISRPPAGPPPPPDEPKVQRGLDGREIPDHIDFSPPGLQAPNPPRGVPQVQTGLDGKEIPSEIVFKRSLIGTNWAATVAGQPLSVRLSDGTRGMAEYDGVEQNVTWQQREGRFVEIHAATKGAGCAGNWTIRGRLDGDVIDGNFDFHEPGCSAARRVPIRAVMK